MCFIIFPANIYKLVSKNNILCACKVFNDFIFNIISYFIKNKLAKVDFRTCLGNIVSGTCIDDSEIASIAGNLAETLNGCAEKVNSNLKAISTQLANVDKLNVLTDDQKNRYKKSLKRQYKNIYEEQVINYLIHNRIIPAYGFPIDVVSFYAGDHTLERDVFTAITEFTPESQLTIEHEKFKVDALASNVYLEGTNLYKPFYIFTCQACNFEFLKDTSDNCQCPQCGTNIRTEFGSTNIDEADNLPGHQNQDADTRNENDDTQSDYIPYSHIRRVVTPMGYRSFHKGDDAAASTFGKLWVHSEDKLLIHPDKLMDISVSENNTPAPATCRYIPAEDKKVEAFRINYGRYHLGYLIDNTTGELISKGMNNGAWISPGSNITRSYITSHLACRSQVGAWFCAIPVYDDTIRSQKSLQELISIALQVEISENLSVDSRALPRYITRIGQDNREAILFCVYDNSGTDNLLKQIDENALNILTSAIGRITESDNWQDCRKKLLKYQTSRALANISEDDFKNAKEWLDGHREQIINGVFKNINGYEVDKKSDNPLEKPQEKVTLLIKGLPDQYLKDKCLVNRLVNEKQKDVEIIFDESILPKNELECWMLKDRLLTAAAFNKKLTLKTADFTKGKIKEYYDKGIRFAIGKTWYMFAPRRGEQEAGDVPAAGNVCRYPIYEVRNPEIQLPPAEIKELRNEQSNFPQPPRGNDKLVWLYKNAPDGDPMQYKDQNVKYILTECGLDLENAQVSEVTYRDPYFLTPKHWRILQLILQELKLGINAQVNIFNKKSANEKQLVLTCAAKDLFLTKNSFEIAENDIGKFTEMLQNKFSDFRVNHRFLDKNELDHGRYLTIEYTLNGKRQKITVVWDKGFEIIDYDYDKFKNVYPQVRLFEGNPEQYAYYNGNYYISSKIEDNE